MPRKFEFLRRPALLVGLLAVGLLAGRTLKPQPSNPTSVASQNLQENRPGASHATRSDQRAPTVPLNLHSTHTLADLLALPQDELYEALAVWLVDASTDEMAAYWNATKNDKNASDKIRDLLFVRWTLTDPLGAIEAAADTQASHIPWWAWAKNNPSAAFEYAMTHDRSQVEVVLRSIGQSDPKRALKLLNDHPDLPQTTGLSGILFGLTRDDPEAAVKLAIQNPNQYDHRPLQAWIRDDPHAAFDWYQANRASNSPFSSLWDRELIKTLSTESPELLAEFASKLPHGALRRQFESAAFDNLIKNNPAKALEQARNNPSPVLATEQLTKIASNLASDDPQQTRSLLTEILGKNPNFLQRETHTYYPNGSSTDGGDIADGRLLIQNLLNIDPQGTFQQLVDAGPSESLNPTTHQAASLWIQKDPEAFADWTAAQSNDRIRNQGYELLIAQLAESNNFESAIQYAGNLDETMRDSQTFRILSKWQSHYPAAATKWSEANRIEFKNP